MKRHLFSRKEGQATTEMVLLFPVLVVFVLFIIKIFGLLVLNQKMQIAGMYAARRYQLQSHVTDFYEKGWDRRYLKKDVQRKVEEIIGFNNPGTRQFLSLNSFAMDINTDDNWTKITLTANTKAPRIRFLCNYDKDRVCDRDRYCLRGYSFLCEEGAKIQVIKYAGKNERPAPYARPENR
ncbi:MAG: pilus assembly protein [Elusimicrobiaceae bacterium]|nr:pilus assembly protein [Elusimicrobiaceae bacterium]